MQYSIRIISRECVGDDGKLKSDKNYKLKIIKHTIIFDANAVRQKVHSLGDNSKMGWK